MGLDFGHTCPDIDRGIEAFKDDLKMFLSEVIDDVCPLLEGEVKDDLVKSYADDIYNEFGGNFENVRKTNEEMRSEADRQIGELQDEVGELRSEIEDLRYQLENERALAV